MRTDPSLVKQLFDRQLMAGSRVGYLHQLLAGAVWTSLFALAADPPADADHRRARRPDRPVVNARIMARLLPHATVHLHAGGHVDLITNAAELAPVIESFRDQPD